jgi:hypothetical protein
MIQETEDTKLDFYEIWKGKKKQQLLLAIFEIYYIKILNCLFIATMHFRWRQS